MTDFFLAYTNGGEPFDANIHRRNDADVVSIRLSQSEGDFARLVVTVRNPYAGLLFGPILGITLAVAATTVSAVLALLLVRALDRDQVAARLTHPAVRAVDRRLARRGWLAVGSLRLIAPVPFSVINYCAGLSSVRMMPYLLATFVGIIPGTIGVVVLGDALTGRTNPGLLVLSGVCITIGVIGLIVDARWGADQFAGVATEAAEEPAPH